MFVRGSNSSWEVRAPAKVNLFFEVLARRADGFHEIETLMLPIRLFDKLSFVSRPGDRIDLSWRWAAGKPAGPSDQIPDGDGNLVVRAVRLLRARAGVEVGAAIRMIKQIPAAAGLGGGSSDAAAALTLANHSWRLGWSRARLAQLAAELGSDIPFFFGRGAAICAGRGEQIRPAEGVPPLHLVVVKPPEGLSTARVYAACRPATRPRPVAPLLRALRRGDLAEAGQLLHNQLGEVAVRLSPWLRTVAREFEGLGCWGHQMTGSGTAYFGLCRTVRHASRVAGVLRSRRVGRVFQVGTCH